MAKTKTKLSKHPSKPTITLQNGTDSTLYAKWTWDWTGTTSIIVDWDYYAGSQGPFPGSEETCGRYERSLYTPPSNATKVLCRIKAEGKSNGK